MPLQVHNNSRVDFMTKFHQISFSIISKGIEKRQITGIILPTQVYVICKMCRIRVTEPDESLPRTTDVNKVNNDWSLTSIPL